MAPHACFLASLAIVLVYFRTNVVGGWDETIPKRGIRSGSGQQELDAVWSLQGTTPYVPVGIAPRHIVITEQPDL
jgi:hypothetical protein